MSAIFQLAQSNDSANSLSSLLSVTSIPDHASASAVSAFTSERPPLFPALFLSKEEYLAYRAMFKAKAHAKTLANIDMLLHAALMQRDPHASFGRTTNASKLGNGCIPEQGLSMAYKSLKWSVSSKHQQPAFKVLLSEATLERGMGSLALLLKELA